MNLREMQLFVEVVRQGGFSRAAKMVFTTQSTISKAVKRLEDELGMPLLERVGRRSKLTAAGDIFHRWAVSILVKREDLAAELDDLRNLKTGVLRLGFSVGSSILFAPLYAMYQKVHPGIDVSLAIHGSRRLEELLLAGQLDLAAMLVPLAPEFEWQEVYTEPLVVLMAKDHPQAQKTKVKLSRLADSAFVMLEEDVAINQVILDACKHRGITPRIVARSRQIDFLVELVALGVGIAFLPRMLLERRHHPMISYALLDEPNTEWHIALAWRRGGYLSGAAREWLALAKTMHAKGKPRRAESR